MRTSSVASYTMNLLLGRYSLVATYYVLLFTLLVSNFPYRLLQGCLAHPDVTELIVGDLLLLDNLPWDNLLRDNLPWAADRLRLPDRSATTT